MQLAALGLSTANTILDSLMLSLSNSIISSNISNKTYVATNVKTLPFSAILQFSQQGKCVRGSFNK